MRIVRIMVIGGSLGIASAGLPSLLDGSKACERVSQWVASKRGMLPTDFASVQALPEAYRRGALASINAIDRSALWRTHLRQVLQDGSLTNEQRSVVQAAREAMTPAFFEGSVTSATTDELDRRAASLFAPGSYRRIFVAMGEPTGQFRSLEAARIMTAEWLRGVVTGKAGEASELCYCRFQSECGASACVYGGCQTSQNCGLGGAQLCVGVCD